MIDNPWTELREWTAARIALGRAGHSLPTLELLAFQMAHAQARDAVHCRLQPEMFASLHPIHLKSAVPDRAAYLRRPDLGRRLANECAHGIVRGNWDAALVIVDGLSATAVHRHAIPFVEELRLQLEGWRIAPAFVVEHGRVAIGDEIGERVGAKMVAVMIGERPGLSSPDSLGVYLTWNPFVGRTDAERNCVSNIRPEGLDPRPAARRVASIMKIAREHQVTGVGLSLTNLLN